MTPCALEYHHRAGTEDPGVHESLERSSRLIRSVRRIDQHEIKALLGPPEVIDDTRDVAGFNASQLLELEGHQIFA